jgi:hypothetical protein
MRIWDVKITKFGDIDAISNRAITFDIVDRNISVSEIKNILNGDLPYTDLNIMSFNSKMTFVIDEDYTLPANKTIWLSDSATLKVAAGAVFTAEGKIETYTKLIIEGTLIGESNIFGY